MILCAGLTPAWQQVMLFDAFRYGEVNRASEALWCASGKVFNAGIAAHRLGGPSLTLAPVGGPPRAEIERELGQMGVPYRWVVTQASTRVCTTILDRGSGTITELVENGRPLSAGELEEFLRAYAEEAARADVALLIGSLPAGTPASFYRRLVERTPCPAILDFRGEGLMGALDLRPFLVKPNREELAQTVGRTLDSDAELIEAMHALNRRGAAWVVVTQGDRPIWVTSSGGAWCVHPLPPDGLVNPIGCGDVMAAAMAWSIRAGRSVLEAVRLGVAAAAANLRHPLPGRFDPTGIHERANQVDIEPIRP